jgi:hypothetical protein
MHSHIYLFFALAILALLVHANTTPGLRADDKEPAKALGEILDNSINFSAKAEAIVMPRIEEWLAQRLFQSTFSLITNASSVFAKLAEYVVESERGLIPRLSFVYSSNENEATIEFEKGPVKEVKLTLLFRASEHGFRASEFHSLCNGKGATVTLVKARNGRMAAAYNGVGWGLQLLRPTPNPRGFQASIFDDPGATGGYSLHKYAANENSVVYSHPNWGPDFGESLHITDRCNDNADSFSFLGPLYGYSSEGVDPYILFGSLGFRVLEYEVYQVEIKAIV